MKNNRRNNMQRLLAEREEFLIIAMTGRVGSGCTEAADILTSGIDGLLRTPPNEYERDKKVLWEYAKYHWLAFDIIKVRTIITTFLLYDMRGFADEILNMGVKRGIGALRDNKEVLGELVKSTKKQLWNEIRNLYDDEPFDIVRDLLVKNRGDVEEWKAFSEKMIYIMNKLYR